jgi:ABC-type transporter Mla maintaining outer membrane lipid asymmetry ATPase subunit MlaF
MVTHDMQSVKAITDRMSLLSQGRIVETGAWQEMRSSNNPEVRKFLQEVPE